jgi:MGT family glycosyltransferase
MTHFGILCLAASGHLNPITTLGYELKQRGHRVTVFSTLDAKDTVLAAGLEFRAIGETAFPAGTTARALAELGKLSGFAALQYTIGTIVKWTHMVLEESPAPIRASSIEMLIIDQILPEGGTIADLLHLPFITVSCAMMVNREMDVPPFNMPWNYDPSPLGRLRNRMGYALIDRLGKPIRDMVVEYREFWKLPTRYSISELYSPLAQLCQQPEEFEFPRQELAPWFHFTGPYHNRASRKPIDFPWQKLTGQPLIYASMGTVQNRLLWVFREIAAACADLDVQLILSLGGSASPDPLGDWPGTPIVVGNAPQLELLPKATLTITHAGMNTTLESLTYGVPMVAIPIANDQPAVAARLAWTGAGAVVPLHKLTAEKLRSAIELVLTDPSYRQNAERLSKAIDRAGGVRRAADIIEQAAATGQPVYR